MIDRDGALVRLGGDSELYDEIVSIFLETAHIDLTKCEEGLASSNWHKIAASAHALKSAAANVGATELATAAQNAEYATKGKAAEDIQIEQLTATIQKLRSLFDKTIQLLSK